MYKLKIVNLSLKYESIKLYTEKLIKDNYFLRVIKYKFDVN